MKAYLLYKQNSPQEREVTRFGEQLKRLQVDVELLEADSREGQAVAQLYDLTGRPAVVLASIDGAMVERWQNTLPLADDVSYLAHT
jgi:hypothetical protein